MEKKSGTPFHQSPRRFTVRHTSQRAPTLTAPTPTLMAPMLTNDDTNSEHETDDDIEVDDTPDSPIEGPPFLPFVLVGRIFFEAAHLHYTDGSPDSTARIAMALRRFCSVDKTFDLLWRRHAPYQLVPRIRIFCGSGWQDVTPINRSTRANNSHSLSVSILRSNNSYYTGTTAPLDDGTPNSTQSAQSLMYVEAWDVVRRALFK